MTHQYRLHQDLLAECLCCHSPQPFHFESPSDQVVCTFCTRHLGAEKAERRDSDHVRLWAELYAEAQDAHRVFAAESEQHAAAQDAELGELRARVDALTGLVAGRFDQAEAGGLRAALETELLGRAERRTELESRRTGRAMQVLSVLAARHRTSESNPLRCDCGKSVVDCVELSTLEPLRREITAWAARAERAGDDRERHRGIR